mmetsp:Transcript_35361/g.40875  ORF Transcript_35361/g.40875 Transcript_35361/m.40875 type:complete len:81 (-) Transcript_35361:114-356(-)
MEQKRVFDHADVFKKSKFFQLQSVTVYGEKYVEAIGTEFFDPTTKKSVTKLAKGSSFDPLRAQAQRLDLKQGEVIEQITC